MCVRVYLWLYLYKLVSFFIEADTLKTVSLIIYLSYIKNSKKKKTNACYFGFSLWREVMERIFDTQDVAW